MLVLGQGDVGQLGLGEDVLERKKPALVTLPEGIVQAVAGGMHTVCLSDTGNVSGVQKKLIASFVQSPLTRPFNVILSYLSDVLPVFSNPCVDLYIWL